MKQAGVATLIYHKIDLLLKLIERDGERHLIFITGKPHKDDVPVLKIYTPNTRVPILVKETVLKFK